MRRQLEHQNAGRFQHSEERVQVANGQLRHQVLEHDIRIDEVTTSRLQIAKVGMTVANVLNGRGVLVNVLSDRNHRRRDVYANDAVKSPGEGLRQPADTATEIQRSAVIGNELKL